MVYQYNSDLEDPLVDKQYKSAVEKVWWPYKWNDPRLSKSYMFWKTTRGYSLVHMHSKTTNGLLLYPTSVPWSHQQNMHLNDKWNHKNSKQNPIKNETQTYKSIQYYGWINMHGADTGANGPPSLVHRRHWQLYKTTTNREKTPSEENYCRR